MLLKLFDTLFIFIDHCKQQLAEITMLYLNENDIQSLQPTWLHSIDTIEYAIKVMSQEDYAQPVKPYLRYRYPENRIIAMPAFLGGRFDVAGIKWISSFPSNINKDLPRAHSTLILNDANTGKPLAILNSGLLSGIRTAAVSGVVASQFIKRFNKPVYNIGMTGFGPIGKLHLAMLSELLDGMIGECKIYDVRIPPSKRESLCFVDSWEKAYEDADIFITCTASKERYINKPPKKGSLQLNISLRDYNPKIINDCAHIIVDNWEEVCRENTDIEKAHIDYGLTQLQTKSLIDLVINQYFDRIDEAQFTQNEYLMFNPMGMAIFDLAIAWDFFNRALENQMGICLKD